MSVLAIVHRCTAHAFTSGRVKVLAISSISLNVVATSLLLEAAAGADDPVGAVVMVY